MAVDIPLAPSPKDFASAERIHYPHKDNIVLCRYAPPEARIFFVAPAGADEPTDGNKKLFEERCDLKDVELPEGFRPDSRTFDLNHSIISALQEMRAGKVAGNTPSSVKARLRTGEGVLLQTNFDEILGYLNSHNIKHDLGEPDAHGRRTITFSGNEPVPAPAVKEVTGSAARVSRIARPMVDSSAATSDGGERGRIVQLGNRIGKPRTKPGAD